MQQIRLGIDTGGTFTDFVMWRGGQITIHKVLSTPDAPERAILQGINDLGLSQPITDSALYIIHGSTVATNAVLEGKGVRTAYITNRGLADVLTIGRQTRQQLYNLQPVPRPPPVPHELCYEIGGRLDASGESVEPLTQADLDELRDWLRALKPDAVAINLLFSYLDDTAERLIADVIPAGIFVARSSAILPEYKEYERGMTTWLNAYVGPLVEGYIDRLCAGVPHAQVAVMQSSGGTMAAAQAGSHAVHMLLSGPAGGLAAAKYVGQSCQQQRLLTFDMGGTSTDVALIDGDLQLTSEGYIGEYPVAVPMVDMHTIGAGGGSIASVDAGGLLQVGPQSAGADPGPACYGNGGEQATVTDANLILGRLRPDAFLGGGMQLDVPAAELAVGRVAQQLGLTLEDAAMGIITIANEHMAQALRVMSIQRGMDPRELTLVSFGGAGGLHVCALAEALEIQNALVPVHAGVLSALGMLVAPHSRQLSQTVMRPLTTVTDEQIEKLLLPLHQQGRDELVAEGVDISQLHTEASLDLRYLGQSYTLTIPWQQHATTVAAFHAQHAQRYGHQLNVEIELVNVRVAVFSSSLSVPLQAADALPKSHALQQVSLPRISQPVTVMPRTHLTIGETHQGPLLITEQVATTYVAPGWQICTDTSGNLHLLRHNKKPA